MFKFSGTLGAAALMFVLPGVAADAQGKGKGSDKGNRPAAAAHQGHGKADAARGDASRSKQAPPAARRADAAQERGRPDVAERRRANDAARGRSDDMNRGRARSAEVREIGGAVAGPADMATANRNAKAARNFRSSMTNTRYFRAFNPNDTPESWRTAALSERLPERYAGRVASLALARGVPQDAIVLRTQGDRVQIVNPAGLVLLELDDQQARNLGAWRVVTLNHDDDDREGSPAFCRSGAGHPNWGRQWCIDKGFGLGSDSDVRWGRAVSAENVVLRPARATTGRLTREVLASVLSDVVLNRLAAHALTLGLVQPLVGQWAVEPAGRRVLLVSAGSTPIAEIVDANKDDRADVLLVALRPW